MPLGAVAVSVYHVGGRAQCGGVWEVWAVSVRCESVKR